jgi:TIGR03009 family protein
MRSLVAWTLTLVGAAWAPETALAQQGNQAVPKRSAAPVAGKAAQPAPAPADPKAVRARQEAATQARAAMDALLEEWEKQSKKIVSLDVAFERIDRGQAWGDQYFFGRAMLRSPDLACLEFKKYKLDANGKPLVAKGKDGEPAKQLEAEPTERIVCTGNEVLQYQYAERVTYIFPLDKQVRQKALQQGPLPFLFNMKADEAKKRYGMTLLEQNEQEYVIAIVPYEDIDRESFTKAFLWLSKATFLPNKLCLIPVGDKERQEFYFTGSKNKIIPNAPMPQDLFAKVRIPGWKEILNPGADGKAPAGNPVPRVGAAPAPQPRRQAAQPANRTPGRGPQ